MRNITDYILQSFNPERRRTRLLRPTLLVFGIVVVLTIFVGVSVAQTSTVVVPNSLTAIEGNSNNVFPFSRGAPMRYQQVFSQSAFASLSGPQNITQIAFRPNGLGGIPFATTCPNMQINLSTTSAVPDGLSPTFAANIGVDDTVVFSGPLPLSSSVTGPLGGPKAFDIVINLATPFLYDPNAGNLLLDVRSFSGCTTTFFDAHNVIGDSVSRVYSLDVNSPVGVLDDFFPSLGLVAQFTVSPTTQSISIDIKPGSDPNSINCNNEREVITVAILSTIDFDATTVDHTTVIF